ncbi:MAG: CehA/McbA family metallohydrolase [bacterium]
MGKAHRTVLLRQDGSVEREDAKKILRAEFRVPESTDSIEIGFDYFPKLLSDEDQNRRMFSEAVREYLSEYEERTGQRVDGLFGTDTEGFYGRVSPLKNLLTLSVYDSLGRFRGCAHRENAGVPPIHIGTRWASSGFLSLDGLPPGGWRLELEVHAVVTERCDFSLEVFAIRGEEGEFPKIGVVGRGEKSQDPSADYRWYAGELHVHSVHSDGSSTIPRIIERARREGYDFIALTDHNTVSGHRELEGVTDFPVIRGIEFTTFYGHATALGLREFVDWRRDGKAKDINSLIAEVRSRGALFSIAHPYEIGDPICTGCRWKFSNVDFDSVDLMEIWSGAQPDQAVQFANNLALWDELLNRGKRIVGISGRDWHNADEKPKGLVARTHVWASGPSEDEIIRGLRRGNVYVSGGPHLDFSIENGSGRGIPGDSLLSSSDERLHLKVEVDSIDRQGKFQIVRDGGIWRESDLPPRGKFSAEFEDTAGGGKWYRCQIVNRDAKIPFLLAFTNPVFVLCR